MIYLWKSEAKFTSIFHCYPWPSKIKSTGWNSTDALWR